MILPEMFPVNFRIEMKKRIMYNVTSAREPEACLHGYGERRGNRVPKSRVSVMYRGDAICCR